MSPIEFFIIVALFATIAITIAGSVSLFRGGEYDATHSNGLMVTRCCMQALTIGLILIAAFSWSI